MRFGKSAIALGIGLLLVGTAPAQQQPRPGGFGGFGGGFGSLASMIGQSKQLQDELKMDKDQVEKLTAALAKVREDMRDDLTKLRARDTQQGEREEITRKLTEANTKAIGGVLKEEQLKRFHQIENQQAGVNMYAKEDVRKALKLTDEQKEKIDEISKDLQKDLRELSAGGRGGFDAEAQRKRQTLQKEAKEHVLKVLNDDQKTLVKDLTGEPFELQRAAFAGGAGGFGGFGGGSRPGTVLSTGVEQTLKLTDEQKKQVEELQKDVDGKLEKILTEEQRKQLKEMRDATRGGGGRTGGAGGRPNRPGQNPNP